MLRRVVILAVIAFAALRADVLVVGPTLTRSTALQSRVAAANLVVRAAGSDALDALDRSAIDVVVLASDETLPPACRLGLSRYLAEGGQVVVVGPAQFDYSPHPVNLAPLPPAAAGSYRVIESERKPGGRKVELPETARIETLATPDGRPALGFRTYLRGMDDFLVEFDASTVRSARRSVLQFWARGDAFMDLLAIEIRDDEGRRWFSFVPLGDTWHQHAVSLADFIPEGWTDPSRPYPLLQSQTVATVAVGTNMATVWPERPMSFAVGGLELGEDASGFYAPTSALAALRLPFRESGLAVPDWLFDPFARATRTTSKTLRVAGSPLTVSEAWLCPVPDVEHPGPRMGTDHRAEYILKFQRESRRIPLWQSLDTAESPAGAVAELRLLSAGPNQGAGLALFGVTPGSLLANKALLDSFAETIVALARQPKIAGATIDLLRPEGGVATGPALQVVVRNPLAQPVSGRLMVNVAGGTVRGEAALTVPARGTVTAFVPLSEVPEDFPFTRFEWRVTFASEAGRDELSDVVDVERGLIYALRHLVGTQRRFPDGRISHHYFGDAYGVRAMFAYVDLLKREPERLDANRDLWRTVTPAEIEACGTRFFDTLVERQNEDGSIPMGYSEHLNVYNVADGGQITISAGQILPLLADPARRERYLQFVRRFADWAETFYIDEQKSAELARKYPRQAEKGETRVGHYGLGWGHLERNETGPFWVMPDVLGVQMLLTYVDSNPDYLRIAHRNLRNYLDAGYRTDGYFWAEALVWSWLTTENEVERKRIADAVQQGFLGKLLKDGAHDMYDRGARANLNALPLIYCRRFFGDDAAQRAALLKYVWAFASEDAPNAMRRVSETFPKPAHGESIAAAKQAACGALWAIELIEPGSSLLRVEGFPRAAVSPRTAP